MGSRKYLLLPQLLILLLSSTIIHHFLLPLSSNITLTCFFFLTIFIFNFTLLIYLPTSTIQVDRLLQAIPAKTQTPVHKRWSDQKRWFRSRSLRSNLIGFVIENLSYNWSIIIYRNSNTNSVGVFHCIKLIYGTLQRRGTCEKQGLCFCWIRSSSLERSVDKFDTMKNSYRICI